MPGEIYFEDILTSVFNLYPKNQAFFLDEVLDVLEGYSGISANKIAEAVYQKYKDEILDLARDDLEK